MSDKDEKHEDIALQQIRDSITIETEHQYGGWVAVDADTYDGPGSPIGQGRTKEAAITDLLEQIYEAAQ
tara:strand:- start:20991 stop:21197 length:207 start_codon:yes stop_codon:yes gene_type:complete